ncbi:Golgi phosphoprotein 3 (GPP34) [Brevibacterium jeotgali]|uniref:Golgi phosphoprotein 3 (GPP34) n=1 Tax=Brevibacterium jeotgali TaxID=1262550 RepID=A0A2H1L4X5_9MICO|nr:Golgi phosphoprotein 3 GPP34 [Brevibacterium jeotgali]SMY11785.1 Golgi phosphoprotein 3 (GPP34) [Brevibacterium jeotgali]
MLICEDLLLLLTRDDGRTEAWVSYRDYALAAGLLADLALADCVEFEDRKKDPKVWLSGELGGGDAEDAGPGAVMDFGVRALAARSKPPRVQALVTAGWFNPKEVVSRSLVAQGVVDLEEARFLGLKPERYPAIDGGPEAHTRARLREALAGRGDVSVSDAMVLGILRGMDSAKVILKEEAAAEGAEGPCSEQAHRSDRRRAAHSGPAQRQGTQCVHRCDQRGSLGRGRRVRGGVGLIVGRLVSPAATPALDRWGPPLDRSGTAQGRIRSRSRGRRTAPGPGRSHAPTGRHRGFAAAPCPLSPDSRSPGTSGRRSSCRAHRSRRDRA